MIELIVTVRDGSKEVEEPFFLSDVPSLTPPHAKSPIFGRWICFSPYLGNTNKGDYYIMKVPDPECSDEQRWISGCQGSRGRMGFFFDSRKDVQGPFLLLDTFYPTEAWAKKTKGWGMLRHWGVKPAGSDVRWLVKY